MVDADILRRRIDALLGYLQRLDRFATVERDRFIADAPPQWIHQTIDEHGLADAGLPRDEDEPPAPVPSPFRTAARAGTS